MNHIPDINYLPQCLSLIDNNIINVSSFTLNYTHLGNSVSSGYLTISTTAELKIQIISTLLKSKYNKGTGNE